MSDENWWDVLVYDGVDLAQQRALRATSAAQSSLEKRVAELERENDQLRQAILRTHAIVTVLGHQLVERKVLDGATIQAEMMRVLSPPPARGRE